MALRRASSILRHSYEPAFLLYRERALKTFARHLMVFLFSVVILSIGSAHAETSRFRYFMQPETVPGSATLYGNNTSAGTYIQSGDAKLYYETYGSGKPFFLFHGGGFGSPYEMGRIIDALRTHFQVVIISTRGHGRSEIGHTPITLEQKARDMLTVMRSIMDRPAPILGFSDGAYTAYALAALEPTAVERLAAIGAGTLKPGFFPSTLPLERLEQADGAYVAQMRSLMPEPDRLQEFLNTYMAFWHRTGIGKDLLASIQCPVLLIGGDRDTHAPPAPCLKRIN